MLYKVDRVQNQSKEDWVIRIGEQKRSTTCTDQLFQFYSENNFKTEIQNF